MTSPEPSQSHSGLLVQGSTRSSVSDGSPAAARPGLWPVVLSLASRRRPLREEELSRENSMRRKLTALDLVFIGIGSSVGAGIFVIVGIVAKPAGPAVCISFLIAAIGSVFSALCYAELASQIPTSGSVYLYAYVAFGEFIALLFGLNLLVDYHVNAAFGTLSCATYLRNVLLDEFNLTWLPNVQMFAIALLVFLTAILCAGVDRGLKQVNGFLVVAKLTIVFLIIVAGSTKASAANLQPFFPYGAAPVMAMSTTCTMAYIGFGTVASAAEESINPNRDLPIGITVSLLISAIIYFTFALVLCALIPFREMDEAAPVEAAFGPKYGNVAWISNVVNWGAIIGLFTTLVTGLYSQARIYLAMSRDGLWFHYFEHISLKTGTPMRAQFLCGFLAALITTFVPIHNLTNFLNIGVLFSYTIVCGGVLVLRATAAAGEVEAGKVAGASAVLTLVSVGACQLGFLLLDDSASSKSGPLCFVLVLVVAACWIPFFRLSYVRPSTFACPWCPLLPVLGITMNGFLLSQCHLEAWLRLAVTTIIIIIAYSVRVHKALRQPCFVESVEVDLPNRRREG